jgi:hypothetical protein
MIPGVLHYVHARETATGVLSSLMGFAAVQSPPSVWAVLASIGAFLGGSAALGSFALGLIRYLDERHKERKPHA